MLPVKQVPENAQIGDEIEVFLYKDSKDRMIATTKEPKLVMGQVAELEVSQVNKFGAFLDWGLEKDLMLPYKQQLIKVHPGDKVLVTLYIDKSERLCATMRVYPLLSTDSPYQKDDEVQGIVYDISDNFGTFVAVDNQFSALIPKKDSFGKFRVGQTVTARVATVKPDGKLDLSVKDKIPMQMDKDAEMILQKMQSFIMYSFPICYRMVLPMSLSPSRFISTSKDLSAVFPGKNWKRSVQRSHPVLCGKIPEISPLSGAVSF